jgi:hypothetical protein
VVKSDLRFSCEKGIWTSALWGLAVWLAGKGRHLHAVGQSCLPYSIQPLRSIIPTIILMGRSFRRVLCTNRCRYISTQRLELHVL